MLVGRSHERSSNDNGQACPSRRGAGIRQEMLTRSGYEEEKCPNYPPTRRTPAQTCGVAADNVEAAQRDCGEHQSCSLRKDQEIPTATRLGMLGLDAELDQSCPALFEIRREVLVIDWVRCRHVGQGVPLSISIHPECPDPDSTHRSAAGDVFLRQEPDEEEDEEDEGNRKNDGDDGGGDDGYSE